MNCGGVAKASISVLKLVSTIQKIGKNTSAAMAQDSVPSKTICRRRDCLSVIMARPSLLVGEVFADHPDQDDCSNVGNDHGDQTASRSHADVELQQRLVVDQIGQVGRGIARAAVCGV